jgi:hypothetical protein
MIAKNKSKKYYVSFFNALWDRLFEEFSIKYKKNIKLIIVLNTLNNYNNKCNIFLIKNIQTYIKEYAYIINLIKNKDMEKIIEASSIFKKMDENIFDIWYNSSEKDKIKFIKYLSNFILISEEYYSIKEK